MPKSHKKRKPLAQKSPKLYCPSTMVRFNDCIASIGYSKIWVCKMCKAFLLSEEAVRKHILICKAITYIPLVKKEEEVDDIYCCDVCNRVFSRAVALKVHKQDHEKSNSDEEFGFAMDSPKKKKMKRSSIKVEYISDEDD